MANKRIKDLPAATDIVAGDIVAIDGATTRGITVENFLKDNLVAIKGLTSAADKGIQFTGSGTAATYDLTAAGKALLDDANAAAQRTTLGLVIGTDVQAYDAGLQSISGLTTAADKMIYTTASDTYAVTTVTSFARTILDDADQATAQTTLGLVPGTDVQAYDADLAAVAGLSSTGLIARTGDGTASVRTVTAPAAGITVTDGDGVLGNPTLALANDLSALEGLSGTGIARRTGSDAWSVGTAVANSELATMANGTIKGNVSGSIATPSDITPSQALDVVGSTRGSILFRGASGWEILPPGTAGQVVTSNGAGADPNYQDAAAGGGGSDTDRRNALLALIYQSKLFASYRRVINQFAAGFKSSDGINAGSSSNYTVDTANGFVGPTTSQTQFTNNVAIGNMTAGGGLAAGFDGNTNQTQAASAQGVINGDTTLGQDWGSGVTRTVGRFKIYGPNNTGILNTLTLSYDIQGSNDNSTWTTIYSGTIPSANSTVVDVGTGINTSTAYRYHRFRGTGNGVNALAVAELQFFPAATVNNMTVVTTAQTSDASVSNGRVLLEFDNNTAAPALNTDLTVEVTCDGGANWSSATLSAVTSNSQGGRKVAETADTACTAGTSFEARIKTFNKNVPIYGVSLTVH